MSCDGEQAAISGGVTPGGAPRLLDCAPSRRICTGFAGISGRGCRGIRQNWTGRWWSRVLPLGYVRPGHGQYPEPDAGCPARLLPGTLGHRAAVGENVAGAKRDRHA